MNFNFIRGLNTKPKKSIITTQQNLIYTTGGTLVVMSLKDNHQKVMPIHDKLITSFDYNKHNNQIATGQEGTDDYKEKKAFIAIIDTNEMKLTQYLMDFNYGIEDLKFSNCGQFLAVHGWDFKLIVYNTKDYSRLLNLQQERLYPQITWSIQDNQQSQFYLIENKKIRQFIFNKDSFKENMFIFQNKQFRNYNTPIFDSYNNCLITGTSQGEIVIIYQQNLTQTYFKKISKSSILSITQINKRLFCITQNQTIIEFNILKNSDINILQQVQINQQPLEIFASFENLYLLDKEGSTYKIDQNNLQIESIIQQPCYDIIDSVYDNENKIIIQFLLKGFINIYKQNGTLLNQFQNKNNQNLQAQKIYYDQQSQTLIHAYKNGDIYISDINNFIQKGFINKAHKGLIQNINMNNKFILTCCDQSLLRIWSSKNYKLIHEFNYHSKEITFCYSFGKESEFIISASKDRQIIIYDLKNERKVKTFQIQNGYVKDIILLNNNKFITIGHNTPLILWDINCNKPLTIIEEELKCLKFQISQNKKYLAILTESGEIKIYETKNLKKINEKRVSYYNVLNLFWINEKEILFTEKTGTFGKVTIN